MRKVLQNLFPNYADCLDEKKVAKVFNNLTEELRMHPFGKAEIKLCGQSVNHADITGYRQLMIKANILHVFFVDIDTGTVHIFEHEGTINREYFFGIEEPVISQKGRYQMVSEAHRLVRQC